MADGVIFEGFTEEELGKAFDRVKEPDWRDPVWALIDVDDIPLVGAAIRYFTATEPQFQEVDPEEGDGQWIVKADGYRMGPAGP